MSPRLEVPRLATFESAAMQTLEGLWAATHQTACPAEVRSLLSSVILPWGGAPIPSAPAWPSDIGDDHSPYEFSLAMTRSAAELRFLVEAQAASGDFAGTRDASLELNERLAQRGADFRRFNVLRDIFLPDVRQARFALWHAVALAPGRLRVKVYLNPQIAGTGDSIRLVREALDRLEMRTCWSTVASAIPRRSLRGHGLRYFAIDLEASTGARVKVYLYPRDVTARVLEGVAALRRGYVQGEVTEFCQAMTGSSGPYHAHPVCVYIAFSGKDPRPAAVTVQVPIRYYVSNDRVAQGRIRSYLQHHGLDAAAYHRALQAVARRPLSAKSGLHTYVSLRTGLAAPRVTVYFGAELYDGQGPASGTRRVRASAGEFASRSHEHSGMRSRR